MAQRCLREDLRSPWPYVLMMVVCGLLLLNLGTSAFFFHMQAAPGREFLWGIVRTAYAAVCLLGVSAFATAITEEKEAATLGLLRLAGVGPWAVLLGKLLNRVALALLLVLMQLPVVLVAVSLGGVGLGTVLAAVLVLLVCSVKLAGLGIAASMLMPSRRAASALALVALVLVEWGSPLAGWLLGLAGLPMPDHFLTVLAWPSAGLRLAALSQQLDDTALLAEPRMLAELGVGVAALVIARLAYARCAYDSDAGPGADAPVLARGAWRTGRSWAGQPLIWKDWHFLHGGYHGLLARVLVIAGITTLVGKNIGWNMVDLAEGSVVFAFLLFVLDAGRGIAGAFRAEHRQGTWPALYALPGRLANRVRSKLLAALGAATPFAVWAMSCAILCGILESFWVVLGAWMILCCTVVFWNYCLAFGVWLRWGGFALAVVATIMSVQILGIPIGMIAFAIGSGSELASALIAAVLGGVIAGVSFLLWLGVLPRLRAWAAEGT